MNRRVEESSIYDLVIDDLLDDCEIRGRHRNCTSGPHDTQRASVPNYAVRCASRPLLPHPTDTWEARRIGGQLLDAATSVAANYRVLCRGRSRAEFIAKLGIVVEEADEPVGWLELMTELELGPGYELEWLLAESRELLATLAASQKTAKQNHQQKQKP
jgi:four helix bundle protein